MNSNSALAAYLDFTCISGDTFGRQLAFYTDSSKTVTIDLTGLDFKMNIVNNFFQTVLSFRIGSGFTISGNILYMDKSATEMRVKDGVYEYDIQRTDSSGNVETIVKGKFIIKKDITR